MIFQRRRFARFGPWCKSLVQIGMVLHQQIERRLLQLVQHGTVQANDGSIVQVQADSICVHGDSPGAVAMARAVREKLEAAGVQIRSFIDKAAA